MWCTTSPEGLGRVLDEFNTAGNSDNNASYWFEAAPQGEVKVGGGNTGVGEAGDGEAGGGEAGDGEAGDWGGETTAPAAGVDKLETVVIVSQFRASTSWLAAGSTISLKCLKKSTPMMGKETAASKKTHSNRLPLKDKTKVFSPQQGMSLPAGPNKTGPEGAAVD
jgi:hypothetical protein